MPIIENHKFQVPVNNLLDIITWKRLLRLLPNTAENHPRTFLEKRHSLSVVSVFINYLNIYNFNYL